MSRLVYARRTGQWDWDKMLKPFGAYFPRGISCADVDSETEIKGQFLVLEGKRTGESLQGGQLYTMNARLRDARTCFIVYGIPELDEVTHIQHWGYGLRQRGNAEDLHRLIKQWADWADTQPSREPRKSSFILSK